jgi:hypothetical protein
VAVGDTPNFLETYDTPGAGSGKTLTPSGSVSDGNGGHNYAYTFTPSSTGFINQAATSVSLQPSFNPASVGQPIVLSATVAPPNPGAGFPTGTVVFKDGSTTLGTATLSNGVATLQATFTTTAQHTLTAVYGGDPNFTGNTSAPATETVLLASKVTLTASTKPTVFGQKYKLSVAVAPAIKVKGLTLTGTVAFLDGSATVGTATLKKGKATLTLASLGAGSHTITAVYGGNVAYGSSASAPLSHTVNPAPAKVLLTSSSPSAPPLESVTFTAKVSAAAPGAALPSGIVVFLDGSATLGTETLSNGVAALPIASLSTGKHTITVAYQGDANYTSGHSPNLAQTIT